MRIFPHPHNASGLPMEVALSADEAERWSRSLQSASRQARDGEGDQMLLFGEPARIVVTVRREFGLFDEPSLGMIADRLEPVRMLEIVLAFSRAALIVILAFISMGLFMALAFRMLG